MITGYNTDVRHRGMVFHVQTEDKGLNNPAVESLVYVGGRIVTRRRFDYARMINEGFGTDEIAALMERQHREVINAIRSGEMDAELELPPEPVGTGELPVVELPPEIDKGPSATQSLDQVILDYLNTEMEQENLVLSMDSPDELRLGKEVLLTFEAKSSAGGRAIEGAKLTLKLISTTAEPEILATGSTDERGRLNLRIRLPDLQKGTAALIASANSEVGAAEIKHLI